MAHSANLSLPDTLLFCSISSPWADEVKGNLSSLAPVLPAGAPVAPAQVMLVVYFGHEIAPVPRGGD